MSAEPPRALLLGKGWFPAQLGGLNRMYRDLLESLPETHAAGVVVEGAEDLPPSVVGVSRHDAPLWRRWAAYRRGAERVAEAFSPDVVDVHFALYAFPLSFRSRTARLPWVAHFQGPWAAEALVQGDRSRPRYAVRRGIERRVYHRAASTLVLTSAFRRELVTRYRVAPWTVAVVPPGVDVGRFTVGAREQARDAFTAVCVRRLVPRMGLEHLLTAWRIALDAGLPGTSRLLIAGEGMLREELSGRIDALGLEESVRLLGRISDARLVDLYRAADVNVVPTVDQEGFGLVVIEAAACGTPSIVTSTGGLPEAVDGLDPSLVVAPADPEALAERLGAARTGALPSRQATRAFAERFSWSAMAARRTAIYRQAAAGRADDRLRVVYLDHVAQLSGGELALLRTLPALRRVNPHVVLFEDGPLVRRLDLLDVSSEVLAMDVRVNAARKDELTAAARDWPRAAWSTLTFTLRLARRLRQLRPDLVHTNSLKSGIVGSVAARLAGVPVVWHLRDRLADDYLPLRAARLTRWWIGRFASAVVANSAATAETLAASGPAVSVVPSPAPGPASARRRRPEGPFAVGMVGRLTPWKGQDVFLRAFAEAFPEGDERAVIVGDALFGEDDFAQGLRMLAEEIGIAERVTWRGFVEDVQGELAELDALVHASRSPEPFGQVVLEAFAARIPVVAADAGGPSEIITAERDGLLCPLGDQAAFAAALRRLRSDDDLRRRLADAGAARLEDFSAEIVGEQLTCVYERVVGR